MLAFISFISSFFFSIFKSKKILVSENIALKQQLIVLKQKSHKRKFRLPHISKLILILINNIFPINNSLFILSPSALISFQKKLSSSFKYFFRSDSHPGRPPVPYFIRQIILRMKNDNFLWGSKRIRDELKFKLGISLDKKTIQKIINNFRLKGKIKKTLSWSQFLKSQADSILATDFLSVDTVLNKRFYILFFISVKSREIVRFAVTESPSKNFVKQQLIEIQNRFSVFKFLIHDNAAQFLLDFSLFGLSDVPIVSYSPNMNAFAERFVRSIRSEALDHHIIVSQKQIFNIVSQYVSYYNSIRPHQGINSIPLGVPPDIIPAKENSKICSKSILGGLHHHYFIKESA